MRARTRIEPNPRLVPSSRRIKAVADSGYTIPTPIQAQGIQPEVKVEEELPKDLNKDVAAAVGEASLRGHLKNPNDEAEADDRGHGDRADEGEADHAISPWPPQRQQARWEATSNTSALTGGHAFTPRLPSKIESPGGTVA